VFIVVMVMTLLAAIGIFAVRATSLVDLASGFNRQAIQTSYLSQYGTMAALAQLGSGTAQAYVYKVRAATEPCRSNEGVDKTADPTPPCYKLFASELNAAVQTHGSEDLIEPTVSGKDSGSFGPNSPMTGDFVVEMTDPGPAGTPVAGTDLGKTDQDFEYVKLTLTTVAQVRLNTNVCTEGAANSSGQQAMRAHVVVGPIQKLR
jgi:hypothetical protein